MISSQKIISLGPDYKKPKGGIAQVLNSYSLFIYSNFKHIKTSGGNNFISKLYIFLHSLIRLLYYLITDKSISALHIHTASGSDFKRNTYYIQIGLFFKKKIILHVHGGGFKEYYLGQPEFVKRFLDKADAIVALSSFWESFFKIDLGYNNVYIVHNIIPSPQKIHNSNSQVFNLLYLGHIYKQKGIFDLVSLLLENRKEYIGKLRLHIGGGLFDVEILKRIILENQLDDVITFHGWVSGTSKIELLSNADAYILPSYAEGVPISILEAMSYSLPIISTNVGGVPSIVNDSNGILIPPADKKAMKSAIDKLLHSKTLCKSLGDKSFEYSLYYQPENVSKELSRVYFKLGITI